MAILVDTSVWIDHFRGGDASEGLVILLEEGAVVTHPFVVGELQMGNLSGPRDEALARLHRLPIVDPAEEDRVRDLIGTHRLWGRGMGWIDAHLLAASAEARNPLWTLDRRLRETADELRIAWRGVGG